MAIRLTSVGADYTAWADGGATVTWAVGSTFHRLPIAAVPPDATARSVAPGIAQATRTFEARVEVPRDVPSGRWGAARRDGDHHARRRSAARRRHRRRRQPHRRDRRARQRGRFS
jgi:hypothetical protein